MEFVITAAIALAVKKIVDVIKMISYGDFHGVLTQLAAWIGGYVAIQLAALTPWADGVNVGNQTLGSLNVWSLILVGLSVGSAASFAHDVVVALDRSGSSVDVDPSPERRLRNLRQR